MHHQLYKEFSSRGALRNHFAFLCRLQFPYHSAIIPKCCHILSANSKDLARRQRTLQIESNFKHRD